MGWVGVICEYLVWFRVEDVKGLDNWVGGGKGLGFFLLEKFRRFGSYCLGGELCNDCGFGSFWVWFLDIRKEILVVGLGW